MSKISSCISHSSSTTQSYMLGFDVSKAKLDYSLVDNNGVEQLYGVVANTSEDIVALLFTIHSCYAETYDLAAIVEATGCYHYPLLEAAEVSSIPCRVYNPIITKQQIRSSIRGKKTDRTDALLIARLGLRGEGRIHTPEPYIMTKYCARSCQKLSLLSSSFSLHQKHITELLGDELTTETIDVLVGIQLSIQRARKQLYKDLAESAKSSTFTKLQTIPGVGPYIAASIIGEIQDMTRFKTAHALTAYAGLDPKSDRVDMRLIALEN